MLNANNPLYGSPDFDGIHTYGDETNVRFATLPTSSQQTLVNAIALAVAQGNPLTHTALLNRLPTLFKDISLNRTGFREEYMVDNLNAASIKGDAALHYRINEKMEVSYNFRYGSGNSIYQGAERYALRRFATQFHRLELKGNNFFVRAYASMSDDGDSYNLSALGAFANERLAPTSTVWLPNYLANYVGGLLTQNINILGGTAPTATQMFNAHTAARSAADRAGIARPTHGTPEYNSLMASVRSDYFKRNPAGAGFVDNSRFYHGEANYNFQDKIKFAEVQVGGNYRLYDLFTDNTIFNEYNGTDKYNRTRIGEFGLYVQAAKSLLDDALKITASVRYDKNQNFKGQVNPRISAVYSVGEDKEHNIRASFQTGFRNPDTQAQFIFFPSGSGYLLGGTKKNAEGFGIYEGGAVDAQGNIITMEYLKPERLSAIEVGYKGVIAKKLMVDANVYYNAYKDFINQQTVFARNAGTNPNFITATNATGAFPAGTMFRPYFNSSVPVSSLGAGLGLTYRLPEGYTVSGNYSFANFSVDGDVPASYEAQFNTPQNKFTLGLGNRNVWENIGFDLGYRWQQSYLWQSAFGVGEVPAFGVLDAQVSYKAKPQKLFFKIGATNLFGKDYQTNFAGPWIGKLYYFSITFDEFLR